MESKPSASHQADAIDAAILAALVESPRATAIALAERTRLSRNTIQARLTKLEQSGALGNFERSLNPATFGYGLSAYIATTVVQRKLHAIANALAGIPEVLEVEGLSGNDDLLVKVVARDADDLYRIAGQILDIDGVERTTTSLVMRRLLDYRLAPLMQRTERPHRR